MPSTLKDIAKEANVSVTTVCQVLANRSTQIPISQETKERIFDAATRLHYRPNLFARSLRTQKTHIIGVYQTNNLNPFLAALLHHLKAEISKRNYYILLIQSLKSELATFPADGYVIVGPISPEEEDILHHAAAPSVLTGSESAQGLLSSVHVDNARGMDLILNHIHSLGHRRIACIAGDRTPDMRARLRAFETLTPDFAFNQTSEMTDDTYDGGYFAAHRLMQSHRHTTAILALDDVMAIGALRALKDDGFRVPEDVMVTGFDDLDLARLSVPTLTTIRQPLDSLARQAVDHVFSQMESPEQTAPGQVDICEAPLLVVRESTAAANGRP